MRCGAGRMPGARGVPCHGGAHDGDGHQQGQHQALLKQHLHRIEYHRNISYSNIVKYRGRGGM